MVNMYSMGMMNPMNNMYGTSGNVHQNFKAKYGVGPEDLGTKPYAQPYPMPVIPRKPEPAIEKSWVGRFIDRCFLN